MECCLGNNGFQVTNNNLTGCFQGHENTFQWLETVCYLYKADLLYLHEFEYFLIMFTSLGCSSSSIKKYRKNQLCTINGLEHILINLYKLPFPVLSFQEKSDYRTNDGR